MFWENEWATTVISISTFAVFVLILTILKIVFRRKPKSINGKVALVNKFEYKVSENQDNKFHIFR